MGADRRPGSVAIVGSGPAGCYTAQALRRLRPDAKITVIERLPVPYGLVRYGIAADHQGTKNVTKQFDRLFERDAVGFAGNVAVGRDVTLETLRELFDAVVIATGLPADRVLGLPGESLVGVHGSGAFTRYLNGYPDQALDACDPGTDVVVIGAGNVAIDVVRLLAGRAEDRRGSDLHPDTEAATLTGGIERITLLARSAQAEVRCAAAMINELGRIGGLRFEVTGQTCTQGSAAARAIAELPGCHTDDHRLTVELRFGAAPLGFVGDDRVAGVRVADVDGGVVVIPATAVITAIGFAAGSGSDPVGVDRPPGVFTAGWAHFGPRGALPDARADGRRVAAEIDAHLASETGPDRGGLAALRDVLPFTPVDFERWRRIDRAEISAADSDRARRKFLTAGELLAAATDPTLDDATAIVPTERPPA
ncbi:FAD-dependent oxidoreductase [Millisia brevis]|uniref:FAD-dependent oxidoreductase n=1 Tax=Millisia brevis TaxID=264148 RepID=UPI00082C0184|nr:FAD-dependent oxidoreductase [Millisia brevis]